MFITEKDRAVLNEAKLLIEDVYKNISFEFKEFTLISIAKDYFELPPRDVQDAWCYPSIANKSAINLCMRPDIATEKLRLKYITF